MGTMPGMEDMMMAMMMEDMMSDMLGSKKKGKGNPFMEMMDEDDDLLDDIFGSDDEYDSDEIEMIGKQMGLSKKEVQELKNDMKKKFLLKQKGKP